jgi:hypothetical protein
MHIALVQRRTTLTKEIDTKICPQFMRRDLVDMRGTKLCAVPATGSIQASRIK